MGGGNRLVAFAACRFETFAIEDAHDPAAVANRSPFLKGCGGNRNRGSPATQNPSQCLLRQRKSIGGRPVMSHKEPAAETLFNGVKFVANGGLRQLHNERLGVVQQDPVKAFRALEFSAENFLLHAVCAAGDLDNSAQCSGLSQQRRDSDDSLVADNAELERFSPGGAG